MNTNSHEWKRISAMDHRCFLFVCFAYFVVINTVLNHLPVKAVGTWCLGLVWREGNGSFAYIGHAKSLCDRKEKGVVHPIAPDQVCRSFVWFSKITTQTSVDFGQKVAGGSCLRRFAARGRSFLMGLL